MVSGAGGRQDAPCRPAHSQVIGIVDYGMGNLRSLRNAFDHVGIDAEVISQPTRLADFERLVVPGVGAFGRAMENIRNRGLIGPLRSHVAAKKPLLGICLGMQLLADRSLEFGEHEGLGFVPGQVLPFMPSNEFPVPHVGWNTVALVRKHAFVERLKMMVDYYFVHSFHFSARSPDDVMATTTYGITFDSMVGHGSVVGCQFHPEKSQAGGLALLERFSEWDGVP